MLVLYKALREHYLFFFYCFEYLLIYLTVSGLSRGLSNGGGQS